MTNYLNQVRHFYVAKAEKNYDNVGTKSAKAYYGTTQYSTIADAANAGETVSVGDIRVGKTADGKEIYFEHVGPNKVITRSDLIPIDNILYANAKKATELSDTRKHVNIALDSSINSGAPIANQDYILNIEISNYLTPSDRNVLVKFGAVHATSNMTASAFWNAMARSIVRNLSRDIEPMLKVYLSKSLTDPYGATTASNKVEVNMSSDVANVTGIVIESVDQDWKLGTFEQESVFFTVAGSTVLSGSTEVMQFIFIKDSSADSDPAIITDNPGVPFDASTKQYTANYNAKKTADLEWFAMKARADLYGMVGYPNYVPTEYLVNPSETYGYDLITIHYADVGSNESVQKSERDITIACPAAGSYGDSTLVNVLADAINDVSGKAGLVPTL